MEAILIRDVISTLRFLYKLTILDSPFSLISCNVLIHIPDALRDVQWSKEVSLEEYL